MKKRHIIALCLCILLLNGCINAEAAATKTKTYLPKKVVTFEGVTMTGTEKAKAAETEPVKEEVTDDEDKEPAVITLLGPNMVYLNESFTYRFDISGAENSPEIRWSCGGEAGEINENGEFTALKKGEAEITVEDASCGASCSLTVHVVETSADVDFVPMINGVAVVNKTYPLPADYAPGDITEEAYAAFYEMQADAQKEGISLGITSGYRSYWYQKQVHDKWIGVYGEATADTLSARPGFSEHQLGEAMDINSVLTEFAYSAEGIWLNDNCWKYGFIIRYPAGKEHITGYIYEPWHIRYLGKEVAEKVTKSGLCLEEYLGIDSYYRENSYNYSAPEEKPEETAEAEAAPEETAETAPDEPVIETIPE